MRLQKSQEALEMRLEKAQNTSKVEFHKNINNNNYKLLFLLSGAVLTCLTLFESIGGVISYPWRRNHPLAKN